MKQLYSHLLPDAEQYRLQILVFSICMGSAVMHGTCTELARKRDRELLALMPSRKRRLCWTGTACTANWASAMASAMLVVAFTFSGSVNSCVHKTMGVPQEQVLVCAAGRRRVCSHGYNGHNSCISVATRYTSYSRTAVLVFCGPWPEEAGRPSHGCPCCVALTSR